MNRISPSLDRPCLGSRLVPGAVLSAILTLAPGVLMAQAHSAMPPEVVTTKVSLADLDLTTPEGVRAARDRLAQTANRLCRRFSDDRRISNVATLEDCTRDTLNKALKRLNRPLVTAAT